MRRRQLLETTDAPWMPATLRDSITETLSLALRWGRYFHGVAPMFTRFLEQSGAAQILDCASGAGDPITILVDAAVANGLPRPDVLLTDLFPNVAAMQQVAARYPSGVSVMEEAVDATRVPEELWRPARTYINCLHHFPPVAVREVLADCARARAALFVLEAFPRDLLRGVPLLPSGAAALFANPLLCRERGVRKALLTYLLPLVPLLGMWDLTVSVGRIHQPEELLSLAREAGVSGYHWEHGQVPFPFGGRAYYFYGVPDQRNGPG